MRPDDRIRELEAENRVLREENTMFADRAEESLLFRLAVESFKDERDEEMVLGRMLESFAVFREVPYCGCFVKDGDSYSLYSEYATFALGPANDRHLQVSPRLLRELAYGPWAGPAGNGGKSELVMDVGPGLTAGSAALIPFSTEALGESMLVCLREDTDVDPLADQLSLLQELVDRTVERLDRLYLLRELERVNTQLESRVERSTEDLERLALAIDQVSDTIVITDPKGTITYANPAFERVSGYAREEAVGGTPALWRSGMHDGDFYQELWDTIQDGQIWEGRFINRRRDGTLFTEDATVCPVLSPSGTIVSYVAVKRDVTAELEVEARLRHTQQIESIGRLAGGVAHDFNNLLTPILGYVELLLDDQPEGTTQHDDLRLVQEAGERARDLTQQILAVGRKQVLNMAGADLVEVVSEWVRVVRIVVREDVDLWVELPPMIGGVEIDVSQIEQVLMNLILNAQDAMPGGGRLTIDVADVDVDEEQSAACPGLTPGDWVRLRVSDTGVGMAPELLERVFEPFFTTKRPGKGTGLGLATVHGIVTQHGGAIDVRSGCGAGTTVSIFLPRFVRPPVGTHEAKRPRKGTAARGAEMILIAEDDPAVRALTGRLLAASGFQVLESRDVDDCRRLIEEEGGHIDLLLTDVVMPGMNGRELFASLEPLLPGLKVVYMSGYSDDVIAQHGVLDPGIVLVKKPLNRTELTATIRRVLDS